MEMTPEDIGRLKHAINLLENPGLPYIQTLPERLPDDPIDELNRALARIGQRGYEGPTDLVFPLRSPDGVVSTGEAKKSTAVFCATPRDGEQGQLCCFAAAFVP